MRASSDSNYSSTKSVWDLEHMRIYECQTNAIKEELEKCASKARELEGELLFVAGNKELEEKIREAMKGAYECTSVS